MYHASMHRSIIQNHQPSISVIIVSWNVAQSLRRCLESVFASQYPRLEVFVIDNASSDDSAKVAKSFRQVKFIQNTKNLGFPKAVNIGLRQSRGDYLVVLNPDTRLPKGFFPAGVEFFQSYPQAWLMGPRLTDPDGTPQGSVFPEPSIISTIREFWLGHKGLTSKYIPITNNSQPITVFAVSGSCLFSPRSTLDKIGLLTEEVFMYYEDLDYCRRIHKLGGQVYFNPQIAIVHEHGHSSRQLAKANPEIMPFWKGHLWASSLWYNGRLKHYLMWFISHSGQKFRSLWTSQP